MTAAGESITYTDVTQDMTSAGALKRLQCSTDHITANTAELLCNNCNY